jgi:hypothetical protein
MPPCSNPDALIDDTIDAFWDLRGLRDRAIAQGSMGRLGIEPRTY